MDSRCVLVAFEVLLQLLLVFLLTIDCEARTSFNEDYNNNYNNNKYNTPDNKMATRCPIEDFPLCVKNGTEFVLLPNKCALDEANKKSDKTILEKIPLRFCVQDCELICSNAYQPVCVTDPNTNIRRTFVNSCVMARNGCFNNIDWTHYKDGSCLTDRPMMRKRKQRIINCTKVFNPVCGTLGGVKSTFINECLLTAENAKTGKSWQIFSPGTCAEDNRHYSFLANNKSLYNASERSYDHKSFVNNKTNELADLGNDVTYIYTPSAFETQISGDDGATFSVQKYYKAPNAPTMSRDSEENIFQNPAPEPQESITATAIAPVPDPLLVPIPSTFSGVPKKFTSIEKPKPIIVPNDDDEKVTQCRFGSAPICGGYADKTRNFDNICELMLRNIILKQFWSILYEGKCDDCKLSCSKEYKPVCVSRNGINYTLANECYIKYGKCHDKKSTWKIISEGECQSAAAKPFIVDKYESTPLGFRFTSKYGDMTSSTTAYLPITTTTTTTTSSPKSMSSPATTTKPIPTTTSPPTTRPTTTTTTSTTPTTTLKASPATRTITKTTTTTKPINMPYPPEIEEIIMRLIMEKPEFSPAEFDF